MTDEDFQRMEAAALADLSAKKLSRAQLMQHAAAMQVAAQLGARAMRDLHQVLLDLEKTKSAADTASKFSSRIGEAIAFMGAPRYLLDLVDAGKAIEATQGKGSSGAQGHRGARKRHEGTDRLKDWVRAWVLKQAQPMRGDDRSVAAALLAAMPAEIQAPSKDPERLIYETIRKLRNELRGHA